MTCFSLHRLRRLIGQCFLIFVLHLAGGVSVVRASSDALATEVPRDAYMLVAKTPLPLKPGDLVIYRKGDEARMARVVKVNRSTGGATVARRQEPNETVKPADITGSVLLTF